MVFNRTLLVILTCICSCKGVSFQNNTKKKINEIVVICDYLNKINIQDSFKNRYLFVKIDSIEDKTILKLIRKNNFSAIICYSNFDSQSIIKIENIEDSTNVIEFYSKKHVFSSTKLVYCEFGGKNLEKFNLKRQFKTQNYTVWW